MSYPKDPNYEKYAVGGGSVYPNSPQMVPMPAGQYVPPGYPSAAPAYAGAPPPYSAVPPYQTSPYAYGAGVQPQPQVYPSGNIVNPAQYVSYAQPTYNPGYPVQPGFNYAAPPLAVAQFDAGARFDGVATHNIPPPPPGCAPNAAQLAAAQGGTVVATQKKSNWFSGNGGGVTLW